MPTNIYLFIGGIVAAIILIFIIADRFKNPFTYPVLRYEIDVSGRRTPSYEDFIDQWIIDNHLYMNISDRFDEMLSDWDTQQKRYLKRTWFWKRHKTKLYEKIRLQITQKAYLSFKFIFFRNQTRYRQYNYQKYAYKVKNIEHVETLTLSDMLSIDDTLESISYETTRKNYFAKDQRKLMTKELRRKIIERDNYTCQLCGKYMPDEVGLHVDHKLAIKNGGKTVEDNLQVLCDKCNLKKGSRR